MKLENDYVNNFQKNVMDKKIDFFVTITVMEVQRLDPTNEGKVCYCRFIKRYGIDPFDPDAVEYLHCSRVYGICLVWEGHPITRDRWIVDGSQNIQFNQYTPTRDEVIDASRRAYEKYLQER